MPNMIPKTNLETDDMYALRCDVAKRAKCVVLPRAKTEKLQDFEERMVLQMNSKTTIMPKQPAPKPKKEEPAVEPESTSEQPRAEGELSKKKESKYAVKADAYTVDLEALNKTRAEHAAKQPLLTPEERKERREAARKMVQGKADDEEVPTGSAGISKEDAEQKVAELMERRKEEAAARAALAAEAALKPPEEETVDFERIGFMQFKKLLQDRGVPKEALFSCANKVALKELALKEQATCKVLVA